MTKTNRSRLFKFIALLLPLLLIFLFAQESLFDNRTYDTIRIEGFYQEEEDSIDVIFMGASEVSNDFVPGYAYERNGFTSYSYAIDSNRGSLYLSQLKEILNHQNPEILFVDLYGFLGADDSIFFDEARLRLYTQSIPFSVNKWRTIMEFPCENKLSYFFPLIMYHGNSSIAYSYYLETLDFLTKQAQPSSLKGAQTRTIVYSGTGDPGEVFDPATYKLSDQGVEYLTEFLDYCDANNLNVIFTNFPRNIADESNHSLLFLYEQAKVIVEQHGYPVWNLQAEMDAIGIDRNQDFYNEHHLNVYGQVKLTEYIGSKVVEEYGLVPRVQSERNRLGWEACASNTREYIKMATDAIQSGNDMVISDGASCWVYRER